MKFLCVPCDRPMMLRAVAPPDRGSLSIVYSCPDCGYEMAMLTNPYETQLVQSLGVRVAPDQNAAGPNATGSIAPHGGDTTAIARSLDHDTAAGARTDGSKCPFAEMISASVPDAPDPKSPGSAGPERPALPGPSGPGLQEIRWTSAAEARLANIPAFVRPMARTGIERFARERGSVDIDEKMLDAARDFFGM